jgi:hypothetical protein
MLVCTNPYALFDVVHCCCTCCTFRGRWPEDAAARDSDGNVFLDADPSLFEVVLNWLRKFSVTKGPAGPHQHQAVHEPDVPPEKVDHMVVSNLHLIS